MGSNALDVDPLARFENEHAEALRELERLEAAALALEAGEDAAGQVRRARESYAFLTNVVREHNENEERALFPLLGDDLRTAAFKEEHRMLRFLERQLGRALEAQDAARRVPPAVHSIADLLRSHIARENERLFPMARALLGSEGLALVARVLDR